MVSVLDITQATLSLPLMTPGHGDGSGARLCPHRNVAVGLFLSRTASGGFTLSVIVDS